MSITREDVLRELELLPVWILRAPLIKQDFAETVPSDFAEVTEEAIAEMPQIVANPAVFIISDDKKWLFILPTELTGQAADLFNNILHALRIRKTQTSHSLQFLHDIEQIGAKVVIAMGESVAQQLLNNIEPLENLRGKAHSLNRIQVVVTYHPDDLLQEPYNKAANKSKTWDDLCLALNILNT